MFGIILRLRMFRLLFTKVVAFALVVMCLLACNLTTSTPTPIPTPDIPIVEILDPPNNRQIIEGTEFNIDIVARDSGAGIAKIEVLIDGELINSATPFENIIEPVFRVQMNWLANGVGIHVIEAIAYRQDGQQSDPTLITIEVLPQATP
jgi:hypothetical protein